MAIAKAAGAPQGRSRIATQKQKAAKPVSPTRIPWSAETAAAGPDWASRKPQITLVVKVRDGHQVQNKAAHDAVEDVCDRSRRQPAEAARTRRAASPGERRRVTVSSGASPAATPPPKGDLLVDRPVPLTRV